MIYLMFVGLAFILIGPIYAMRHPRTQGEPWTAARKWSLGAILLGVALMLASVGAMVAGSK